MNGLYELIWDCFISEMDMIYRIIDSSMIGATKQKFLRRWRRMASCHLEKWLPPGACGSCMPTKFGPS